MMSLSIKRCLRLNQDRQKKSSHNTEVFFKDSRQTVLQMMAGKDFNLFFIEKFQNRLLAVPCNRLVTCLGRAPPFAQQ